jgi:hypothetical protein
MLARLGEQSATLGSANPPQLGLQPWFSFILPLQSNREHVYVELSYLNQRIIHALLISFHL